MTQQNFLNWVMRRWRNGYVARAHWRWRPSHSYTTTRSSSLCPLIIQQPAYAFPQYFGWKSPTNPTYRHMRGHLGTLHWVKTAIGIWCCSTSRQEAETVTIHMTHGLFSSLSHTYSTSFPHLLHSDSYLSHLWLIVPTLAPLWPISLTLMTHRSHTYSTMTHLTPICTFTIYMARYPPVNLAWSYSNIPEF